MKLQFIGNSHTYFNEVPATVLALLRATGGKAHATMLASGGKTLAFHAAAAATAFNIKYGEYDFVIVQDRGAVFENELFESGAARLKEMIDEAGSKMLLYMPWPLLSNRDTQKDMTAAYLDFAEKNCVLFAAAGEAFGRVLQHEKANLIFCEDGNHATPLGSYLAALTVFYTLTGRKRPLSPDSFEDPGIAAGFSPAHCRSFHIEACHIARLYNG